LVIIWTGLQLHNIGSTGFLMGFKAEQDLPLHAEKVITLVMSPMYPGIRRTLNPYASKSGPVQASITVSILTV